MLNRPILAFKICLSLTEDPRELVTFPKQKSFQVLSQEEQGPVLHVWVMLSPPTSLLRIYSVIQDISRVLGSRTRKDLGGSYWDEAVGTESWPSFWAHLQLHACTEHRKERGPELLISRGWRAEHRRRICPAAQLYPRVTQIIEHTDPS